MHDGVQDLFSRRLKLLREKKEVTMVELADAIGMSQATISEWEKGNKFPRSGALQQLATYFNVPIEYYFKEEAYPSVDLVTIRLFPSILAATLSIVQGLNDDVEVITLPKSFLGKYATYENLMAFTIKNDSMDLLFPSGATIVAKQVQRDEDIEDGDIGICRYKEEFFIKRIRRNKSIEVLVLSPESTNKNFHDIVIPFKSRHEIEMIAKVIWYGVLL